MRKIVFNLSIFRPTKELGEVMQRFTLIHKYLKPKIIYPILKGIKKILGKFILKGHEDIPELWFNNYMRIMMRSFEEGLDDMWLLMHKHMSFHLNPKRTKLRLRNNGFPEDPTDEEYLEYCHSGPSHIYRKLIKQIEFTEALDDTIDRSYFDSSLLRMVHYTMKHHGVSKKERDKVPRPGDWPMYKSETAHNPQYFIDNKDIKVFNEKDIK